MSAPNAEATLDAARAAARREGFARPDYRVTPSRIYCVFCDGRRVVVGTKVVNKRADATEVYRLACGHVVL